MKIQYVTLIVLTLFLIIGCTKIEGDPPKYNNEDSVYLDNVEEGTIFCDAKTRCPIQIPECYKVPGVDSPRCFSNFPDINCSDGELIILESYPPQLVCNRN